MLQHSKVRQLRRRTERLRLSKFLHVSSVQAALVNRIS